jgi:hypothetical protein
LELCVSTEIRIVFLLLVVPHITYNFRLVKRFGFTQKLFDVWCKNNAEKFQTNEEHDYTIEQLLSIYLDSIKDDDDISQVLILHYQEKI